MYYNVKHNYSLLIKSNLYTPYLTKKIVRFNIDLIHFFHKILLHLTIN